MIAISLRGQREWLVRLVTRLEIWRGNRSGWVWGMEERDPHRVTFQTQLVTSDSERFERTQMLLREHPDLRLAGATWGWLSAALASMDWLRAPGRAETITTPKLIVGAGKDRICLTSQTEAFARRAPNTTYLQIEDAEHEIMMERNLCRVRFWSAFDDFMGGQINRQKETAPR